MKIEARWLLALAFLSGCIDAGEDRPPAPEDPDAGTVEPPTCIDNDGDGFGQFCEAGGDCDDEDLNAHEGCVSCGSRPQEGCACEGEQPVECHSGAPEPDEHGRLRCQVGHRDCVEGTWSECIYEESYWVETPSGDMRTVQGNPEPCANCDPQCLEVGGNFVPGDLNDQNSSGVHWDPAVGGVVLGGRSTDARYAYIAMTDQGTVAKIRTSDGAEVGRYYVGETNGLPDTPSRTAIDGYGNAYVANRGINGDWWGLDGSGNWGTVTKIAGDPYFCIDRNNNGTLQTSTNSTPLPEGTDECVLWTKRIGNSRGSHPRALAIDRGDAAAPEGYVWVGTTNDKDNAGHTTGGRAYKLSPATGAVLRTVQLPLRAYGAVADASNPQRIWFTSIFNGGLAAVRTDNYAIVGPVYPNDPSGYTDSSYGIAGDGTRIWRAGWSHRYGRSYDPATGLHCLVNPWAAGDTTGITVLRNANGSKTVYMAHDTSPGSLSYWDADVPCVSANTNGTYCSTFTESGCSSTVTKVRSERWYPRAQIHTIALPNGANQTWGVAPDADGRIWAVNQASNNVTVYNPVNGAFVTYPSTVARLPYPYTYSDFTGYIRSVFTNSSGSYSQNYGDTAPVCALAQDVTWGDLSWNATVPARSRIRWEVRTAGAAEDLPFATPVIVGEAPTNGSPIYLEDALVRAGVFSHHRYLRVSAVLVSDDNVATPILRGMNVDWLCLDRT